MDPLTRQSKTKRVFTLCAAIAAIAAADLLCVELFGDAPWVLDFLTSIALLGVAAFGVFVLPLLLADWLARIVPRPFRVWVWLALAVVFAAGLALAVSVAITSTASATTLHSTPAPSQSTPK